MKKNVDSALDIYEIELELEQRVTELESEIKIMRVIGTVVLLFTGFIVATLI
jgi:hypothetical protein|tara:strand:+ start:512 stop:667 length:156 start_codon:yes stop_codon:yes gene_type:complete